MNTPRQTDRSDHLDATDLLDEHGKVDLSKVRSRANAANGATVHIDAERCAELREHLAETRHAGKTAAAFDHGETAVRRHVKGECHHDERAVDAPPLTFTRGVGWEVRE
ncbi:hypothetical protein HRTV-28_gp66 [Halorubrum tailed virus 28]|uniref:Uncharacterized protein n=1 Tax=Halorubrum tailed virus 28 TaxID=2878009 RepID=A0AAE8Y0C5_9CAUD|nr:hypothetical protein M1M39_gp67 [Halorubrum tailed virus 28]UBF23504.1 hypothetical protein HRTV-28_gp66 [Halorubrum tailed virus 28]